VTDTLLIQTTITGINPPNNSNTLRVFPNPANDHITIDYGNFILMNGYQLKIENSLGQQVFQTNITQQSDYISLTNWGGNGLYFVRIINPQGNTIDIRKIVLQ
ncbi:MAG: T9SS type A sorting domain-containing protein, partial [Bacteroidota bacterium]